MRIFPTDKNQIKKDDMRKMFFILTTGILLAACGTPAKVLTSDEIRTMTTRIIQADYDMTFTSALSLLQSEGFLINNTDKETGLINASKQEDASNATLNKILWGSATEAYTTKAVFLIIKLNDRLTEVKLTMYQGSINTFIDDSWSENQTEENRMVQNADIYRLWLNNLEAEIARRESFRGNNPDTYSREGNREKKVAP